MSGNLKLFLLAVITQATLIFALFTDINWSWVLGTCVFTGIIEQIFFHRLFAHRAWECPRWLELVGLHISSLLFMGTSVAWVAVHRLHHSESDTSKDPHSPLHKPWWYVQFFPPYFEPFVPRYAKDLLKDPVHKFYFYHYFKIVILSHLLILVVIGIENYIYGFLPGIGLAYILANSVNVTNHGDPLLWISYRNKNAKDYSLNNRLSGYLTFDGWHSNHHVHPTRWYYGSKWYEIDLAGVAIAIITILTGSFRKNQ